MSIKKSVYTVSGLTSELKSLLEDRFPVVWITGEVTNFASPASGHFYFTLKDEASQIRAVMFKGQNRKLSFQPENGMVITGLCRISVYEPRGTYQLIFELLEPKGTGALQIAFEQLKKRLFDEGLFNDAFKAPMPFLPQKINIVTSPSGAVIHDIMNIINRRYSNIYIQLLPVKVQGIGSEDDISNALEVINARMEADVIILARGGGSLEDLRAFNSESVARSIFASKIPVVSAVGHETDFTISDFVADLRAPTPSAAAELIVPEKTALKKHCDGLQKSFLAAIKSYSGNLRARLELLAQRLKDPEKTIQDFRFKLDDLVLRMSRSGVGVLNRQKDQYALITARLQLKNPLTTIDKHRAMLGRLSDNLINLFVYSLGGSTSRFREVTGRLHAMNPRAILSRGYSITRTHPGKQIIKATETVAKGQHIETLLEKGALTSIVEGKKTDV